MKRLFIIAFVVMLGLGMTSMAGALTIDRYYDPYDVKLTAPNYIDWWMYLAPQYDPSTMFVEDAWITLYLRGDGDTSSEAAKFQVSTSGLQTWTLTNPNIDVTLQITSGLSSLQDGSAYFMLKATEGDFIFEKAWLRATVASVPEPTSLLLLGLGLLGIAGWRRK